MDMTLGETILMLRRRKNWSQGELACKSGLSTTYISLLERDKVNSTTKALSSVFAALEHKFTLELGG